MCQEEVCAYHPVSAGDSFDGRLAHRHQIEGLEHANRSLVLIATGLTRDSDTGVGRRSSSLSD